MIFKVDFEKAYDSVRWDFIDDILRMFGFGEKWCASKYKIYSCAFFNGADVNSKKPSWVRWKSVLAAKDVCGLGVSSLFALNRALMFKWVWRFFSQKNSLWVRVVKVLHGEDEKIGKKVQPRYPSIWLNIINEIESLKLHGIDQVSFITPKLGNGVNTSFWDIAWCGDIAVKNLVPRLYALKSMKNIEVASKLSHGGLEFSFRRNPIGGVEQAQFERLKEMVEGVTLSNSDDRWSWSLVGSGDFSVSSVKKLIDNVILPNATKMSKLDRFLVREGLVSLFPHISGICLDRHLSDHRPILLWEVITDYGAMPFRMYHSWFSLHGFEQMVTHTWNSIVLDDRNGMVSFKKKMQFLKKEIWEWVMDQKQKQSGRIKEIKSKLSEIDKLLDQGGVNDEILLSRIDLLKQMQDIKSSNAHDCVMVDGEWMDDPSRVKEEFRSHFATRFQAPGVNRSRLNFRFPNRLNPDQVAKLENLITRDEFFDHSSFTKGCNSSFVALIPKTHDPKFVSDYRPINLIGSLYKDVTKILDDIDKSGGQMVWDLNGEGVFPVKDLRNLLDESFLPKDYCYEMG
nr:RNA-directed DNA polymerase, eukaryota, reverse transcriptase zinc-binding domain protein [Tanacetum cinerariifolium]